MGIFKKGTLIPVTPTTPVTPPNSGAGPIYGCDVYHLDDVTSFSAMKVGGIDFVIIKASEGMGADPKFVQYYREAKAAGLIVGAYHFYSTAASQSSQAAFFNSILQSVGYSKQDITPCFDFEKASGNFSSDDGANCLGFLKTLQQLNDRVPLLYMSESTYAGLNSPSWMLNYPWWLARYRAEALGPGTDNWVFWQFSESASIPGLGNAGDKNKFRSSVADLQSWISKT